ncbi:MAG TPA: hypothetical protein VGO46_19665 [Gemmatimonadaceae bacterium]|jgi:hypothetical protein|nr:hypothetical protein [Gemmatimonadaceae bacterium]
MTDTDSGYPEGARDHDGDGHVDSTAALRVVIQMTLRTDLRRVLSGCPIEQSGLRENLRTIGAHARRHMLRAEQLLILLKEACASLPEARELLASQHPDALDKIISMAVEEYYGPVDSPSRPAI